IHSPLLCSDPWKRNPVRKMNNLTHFPDSGLREYRYSFAQIVRFLTEISVEKRLADDFESQGCHGVFNINDTRVRQLLPHLSKTLRLLNHRIGVAGKAFHMECRLD